MWEKDKLNKQKTTIINFQKLIYEIEADNIVKSLKVDTLGGSMKEKIVQIFTENERKGIQNDLTNSQNEQDEWMRKLDSKKSLEKTTYSVDGRNLIFYHTNDIELRFITSVQTAIEEFDVDELYRINPHIGEFVNNKTEHKNREYFFRGHEKFEFGCVPSLLREKSFFDNEDDLYNELQTLSPKNFLDKKKHLEILTEMQHFSLPTRLLDISSNPLSALFFSVFSVDQSTNNSDGEVIVFDVMRKKVKKFSSDIVEIQTSLAYMPKYKKNEIQKAAIDLLSNNKNERIHKFNEVEAVRQLIHEASKSGINYQNVLDPVDLFNMYICLPLKNNERIYSQSGAFISYGLLSKAGQYDQASQVQANYEKQVSNFFLTKKAQDSVSKRLRYIVPYQYKQHIRRQLQSLGINQGNIYPDIEKRSGYIKEKYRSN